MKLHLRENVLGQVQFCTQGRFLGPWAERHYKSSMQEIVDEHDRQAAEIERLRRALEVAARYIHPGERYEDDRMIVQAALKGEEVEE